LISEEDHYTKECPHWAKVSKFIKSSPTLAVLKDAFPQDSKMASHNQSSASPSTDIMIMSSRVMVAMRSKDYASKSPFENGDSSSSSGQTYAYTPPSSEPLHIEKTNRDMLIHLPPKGMLRKSAFNPHIRVAQNDNIVEDLAMPLSAMSSPEVLKTCSTERKLLLSTIRVVDPQESHLIFFDLENHVLCLPHQLDF